MSTTPEGRVKAKFISAMRELFGDHVYLYSVVQGMYTARGASDIFMCVCGRFIAVEVKATPKKKPTKIQKAVLERVVISGGLSYVVNCDNIGETVDAIFAAVGRPTKQP